MHMVRDRVACGPQIDERLAGRNRSAVATHGRRSGRRWRRQRLVHWAAVGWRRRRRGMGQEGVHVSRRQPAGHAAGREAKAGLRRAVGRQLQEGRGGAGVRSRTGEGRKGIREFLRLLINFSRSGKHSAVPPTRLTTKSSGGHLILSHDDSQI